MSSPPGYLDLQVNGYAGVDFNQDRLSAEDVVAMCQCLRDDGVDGILATVITDTEPAMIRRLENIARVRDVDTLVADVIWGIHIEGPFLNPQPGYIGAHPANATREADLHVTHRLLDAAQGLTRIVTLAPECDPGCQVVRMLAERGITVSAGHCNASLEQLRKAIDAGLTMFTHLGNGCPLTLERHDNIIQRVLSVAPQLWIGFIADGVHIPYFALRNYLRVTGYDRALVVTDAISAAGCGPGKYFLANQSVLVDENLATWTADRNHLVGSAGTLPFVTRQLRAQLGLGDDEIVRLTTRNPRAAIGAG